jgi:hypothetical protein
MTHNCLILQCSGSLIGKLLIGYLDQRQTSDDEEDLSYLPQPNTKDGFAIPAPKTSQSIPEFHALKREDDVDDEDVDLNLWDTASNKR